MNAQPLTVVWFEETGEQRSVWRYCTRCASGPEGVEEVEIVSPDGLAHAYGEPERTRCGINATATNWWWRL